MSAQDRGPRYYPDWLDAVSWWADHDTLVYSDANVDQHGAGACYVHAVDTFSMGDLFVEVPLDA